MKNISKALILSMLVFGFTVSLFAQAPNVGGDVYLDDDTGLKIYAPSGWERSNVPEQMSQTKVIWHKAYPQGRAYMILKTMRVSPEETTKDFAFMLAAAFSSDNMTKIIVHPEETMINNAAWVKMVTEAKTKDNNGKVLDIQGDVYCFVKDGTAIQIQISANKEIFPSVMIDTEKALSGMTFEALSADK